MTMASQHENGAFIDPNPIGAETSMASQLENGLDIYLNLSGVETHDEEIEKFDTLGCAVSVEEDVENITLKGSSLAIEENGVNDDSKSETECGDSESENSNSESSSSDSDKGSSSSGSDSEDDEDVEVEEGEVSDSDDEEKMVSWSMFDDDEDGDDVGGPIKSKNELQNLPPVPPVDATIEPHHQMLPVGIVTSIVGAQVIVEGVEKHDPLTEGSILWLTESRKPLGFVDEIFGPVKNPFYIVRYNSESEVPNGIHGETLVSFVPEFADHVLNNKNLYRKGYDASGANDEELSEEMEFSDDEQEAEYKKKLQMTKRGVNEQNHINRNKNRKKFLPREHMAPAISAAPLPDHGNCPPFSGTGQGLIGGTTTVPSFPHLNAGGTGQGLMGATTTVPSFPHLNAAGTGQGLMGGTTTVPSFPHLNAAPNFATNGVWTNGTVFPPQLQPSAMLPNGFPANGMSLFPQNTQISPQLPMQGVPFFQQQLHPIQGSLSTIMQPGMQSNMFGQSMYATGLGQNQMTFGMGLPFSQMQPPIFSAQQGFPSTELHPNNIPGAPRQFHRRPFVNRGRKTFHGAGRRGGRPAN